MSAAHPDLEARASPPASLHGDPHQPSDTVCVEGLERRHREHSLVQDKAGPQPERGASLLGFQRVPGATQQLRKQKGTYSIATARETVKMAPSVAAYAARFATPREAAADTALITR